MMEDGPYEFVIKTGEAILIDGEDVERVSKYSSWRIRSRWLVEGGPVNTLGRFLIGLEPGDPLQCHHINGNPLDNRKDNLVALTLEEHQAATPWPD